MIYFAYTFNKGEALLQSLIFSIRCRYDTMGVRMANNTFTTPFPPVTRRVYVF